MPLDRVARAVGRHRSRPGRDVHDVLAVDRDVGRLDPPGLRRGARQGARPRGAAAELQPATISPWSTASSCRTARRPARTTGRSRARSTSRRRPPARRQPKKADAYKVVGKDVPRFDLPAKVTGAAFVHDVLPRDVLHARTLRQPNPGATLAALDEAAIRRAAKGELQIVREANFVAFVSPVESVAQAAAAAAPAHARWDNLRQLTPAHQEAAWLKGQPAEDRQHRRAAARRRRRRTWRRSPCRGPTSRTPRWAPSCALAEFRDGHLTVQSHGQGMHPLRKNLAAALGLPIEAITAQHLHGPGCYGHNGADDAALDAALVAMRIPGRTHPPAMAARGGVRLRAGRAGDAGDPACRSRRQGPAGRLDDRDLERRRMCSGRAAAAATCWRPRRCPIRRPR